MELLPRLITTDLLVDEQESTFNDLLDQIIKSKTGVLPVVTALGPFLTSSVDGPRAKAVALLAQIITEAPQVICSPGDVGHLAGFFTGRLTDWPAVRGALSGCLALLSLPSSMGGGLAAEEEEATTPAAPAALNSADAVHMMATFADHVFVRSLGQQDRCLAFNLLTKALEAHGQTLLDSHQVDILELVIASLDGEKDPRALLQGLHCVRTAVALYVRQPDSSLHSQRLEDATEELFDVVAAYFPVSFTPPPNDPHRITRAQLAEELEETLAATPLFADNLLQLLLDKLGASLRQAKLDSLSVLGTCAQRWGFEPLAGHVSAIWGALKAELLPASGVQPLGVGFGGNEVALATAQCLSRLLLASCKEGHWELLEAVWGDAAVQDLFACLPAEGCGEAGETAFARRVARVRAATAVLGAVCQAGEPAASRLHNLVMPRVLPLLTPTTPAAQPSVSNDADALVSRCLALQVLLSLLQAEEEVTTAAAARAAGSSSDSGRSGAWQPQLLCDLMQALLGGLPPAGGISSSGEREDEMQLELWAAERSLYSPGHEAALRLRVLQTAFSIPGTASQLDGEEVQAAVDTLVACILRAPALDIAPFQSQQQQGRQRIGEAGSLAGPATAALCALAGTGLHAELMAQHALRPLAAAASATASGQLSAAPPAAPAASPAQPAGAGAVRHAALATVNAIAGCHPACRMEALSLLGSAIQQLLPAAVSPEAATGSLTHGQADVQGSAALPPSPQELMEDLLSAAREVLSAGQAPQPAAEPAVAAAAAETAADVDPLARGLFQAVMALPGKEVSHAPDDRLLGAIASTVFQAVCIASEPAQQAFLEASGTITHLQSAAAAHAGAAAPGTAGMAPLQTAACCAVLAALRPAVLSSHAGLSVGQLESLLGMLLSQALVAQPGSGGSPAGWAALAVASTLNKWRPGEKHLLSLLDGPELHKAIHTLLERHLFPFTIGAPGTPEPDTAGALLTDPEGDAVLRSAWACLALVTKGLVMRAHPAGDGVLAGALGLLRDAALAESEGASTAGASAGAIASVAEGGAEGVEVIMVESPAPNAVHAATGPAGGDRRLLVAEAAWLFGTVLSSPGQQEGVFQPPGTASSSGSGRDALTTALIALPDLGPQMHAVVKPLWQQRLFTVQSGALLRALQSTSSPPSPPKSASSAGTAIAAAQQVPSAAPTAAAQSAPSAAAAATAAPGTVPGQHAPGGHQAAAAPAAASPLMLALAHLLHAAPPGVLHAAWPQMLPWMPRCLAALLAEEQAGLQGAAVCKGQGGSLAGWAAIGGGKGEEGGLVLGLVDVICEALMAEEGRQLLEGLLLQAVPALLAALRYRSSAQVRERAAQGLLLLVQLPYAALHPYRKEVLRGLVAALDDNRRAVRQQAAQARQAWIA